MIDDIDLTLFRHIHITCDCEVRFANGELSKDGCEITVENLVVALDCDDCQAFTENDTRPDIIAIQKCHGRYEWLIIEMKSTMRLRAAEQAKAALDRLGQDRMFRLELADAHVVFVVKNPRRKADYTIMRKIRRIETGRWRVVPRLCKSGSAVGCV